MAKKYAFGIDLGTTNSCIAVKPADKPASIITLADGQRTLPSCVMYKDGKVVVGYEAYKQRYDVKHVVYSSKRDIGSNKEYLVYADGDDKPPRAVTPVDVATEILKKLKEDAELIYGKGIVTEVTITVPAYFTAERRAATIQAAENAGLKVLALINEPTAAAIAYTAGKNAAEQILVYDLGGGTFDVTLLEMLQSSSSVDSLFDDSLDEANSIARVVTSQGNPRLGGDDIDELTYSISVEHSKDSILSHNPQLPKDINLLEHITLESMERLVLQIEKNKKEYSVLSGFVYPVELKYKGKVYSVQITVSVEAYSEAFRRVYAESIKLVRKCLEARDTSKISKIILIGGSTKLQILRDRMSKDFDQPIYTALNPDEAVALGAATNTSILYGDTNMAVSDVLPQSIGIEHYTDFGEKRVSGRFSILIRKDTPLPTSAITQVRTLEPGQTEVTISVLQGEDTLAANNSYIGVVHLKVEPSEEIQEISVRLSITAFGVLQATVASATSKVSVELQNVLRPTSNVKTAADKFVTRYRVLLQQFEDDAETFARGTELLDGFERGTVEFSEMKQFFNKLTQESREASKKQFDEITAFNNAVEETHTFDSDTDDDEDDD